MRKKKRYLKKINKPLRILNIELVKLKNSLIKKRIINDDDTGEDT